jgi:hypothetical protein
VVVTASGLFTSTSWWTQVKVEDSSVVVRRPSRGGETSECLLLAECETVDAARALFGLISGRFALGAPVCDVRRLTRSLDDVTPGVVVEMPRST